MALSPLNRGLGVHSWLHPDTSFTKLQRTFCPQRCLEKGSALLCPFLPLLRACKGINQGKPSAAKKATARDVPLSLWFLLTLKLDVGFVSGGCCLSPSLHWQMPSGHISSLCSAERHLKQIPVTLMMVL